MASVAPSRRATWRDYLVLTKPKVISLLLFTTVGAMFIAAEGFPGLVPLLGLIVGGAMSAGATGAFNLVYDRDIDGRMKRTAKRPTVTHVVPSRDALLFAAALTLLSFLISWASSNVLAALLSALSVVMLGAPSSAHRSVPGLVPGRLERA